MTARPRWSTNGLDLVTLRLFMAAVEEGSFARAADRENIAISAISRRISDLESRCGLQLLDRGDRGVTPTAAGEMVLGMVRQVFQVLDRMVDDVEAVRGGTRGTVHIFAHMSAMLGALPAQIAMFGEEHPGIDVHVSETTSLEALHAVRTGVADIGFVSGTVEASDFDLIPWVDDELVVILPPKHPLAKKHSLLFSELLDYPMVGMQRNSALLSQYRHHALALGRALIEKAHASSFGTVRKLVALGLGVAILPAMAVAPIEEADDILVRPLRESWAKRPLMICVRDKKQVPRATKLLMEYLLMISRE